MYFEHIEDWYKVCDLVGKEVKHEQVDIIEQGQDVVYDCQVMHDTRCLNHNVGEKEGEELSID